MKDLEYILDFTVKLSRDMIYSGANIERVQHTIDRITHTYGLHHVCMDVMSSKVNVAAKDAEGNYAQRQISVAPQAIDLARLQKLNALSYDVTDKLPDPKLLKGMLDNVQSQSFPKYITLLGFIIAMACLGRMFGGHVQELLIIELNTILLYGLSLAFSHVKINKIITNFISMFIVTLIGIFFVYIKFVNNFYTIIITNAFFLIPGIPMVNSVRNIICGNEMNGIIDLLKVVLEVVAIVSGIAAAFALFGEAVTSSLEESIYTNSGIAYYCELTFLSIFASFGFGIVFNIQHKDLIIAGLCGLVIRVVYIFAQLLFPEQRIVYVVMAAFSAALFSQILAFKRKEPSTLYLYPSIVPLIPGDLFYYTCLGIIWSNVDLFSKNAIEVTISLVGISIGFVICSAIVDYVRKIKFKNIFNRNKQIIK